jgi:hypothetical protein
VSAALCPTQGGNKQGEVPKVGMARMAGSMGSILAVLLLGCARICQMAPESRTVRLNQTYSPEAADHGQAGTRWYLHRSVGERFWSARPGLGRRARPLAYLAAQRQVWPRIDPCLLGSKGQSGSFHVDNQVLCDPVRPGRGASGVAV